MASSGDELDFYEQSPRVYVTGTSKKNAHPVAGPSKSGSKRRRVAASDTVGVVNPQSDAPNPIAISSGEEDVSALKREEAITAIGTPNGRATSGKGKGKEMATAKRRTIVDSGETELIEDAIVETDANGATTSRRDKVRHIPARRSGSSHNALRTQNERSQRQLEEITQHRDSLSRQLEELFELRHTSAETRLEEQRAQFEAYLKVKEDTIQELQSSLSRVDKLSEFDATTTLHFLTRQTADEEKLEIQREVENMKTSLRKKDETIHAKDVELANLQDTIKILRSDLKAEIEKTRGIVSRNPPSTIKHASRSSDTKNALVIHLYEELTNLLVTNVRHEPGMFREEDAIYTCVQTTSSGKSLNFELKFCKEIEESETPSSANKKGRKVDKVVYRPLSLENESEEFVQQLDFLARPFTFQEEQMSVFTKTLLTYLEGETEDSPSNTEQMDAEE